MIDNNFWFGGMEYPGFVLDLVSTTALTHELGHQWFYGIVGDDEYNSPWLDEAFTDYATDLALGQDRLRLLEQRLLGLVRGEDHQLDGVLGRALRRATAPSSTATASARCTTCGASSATPRWPSC